jgi:hypothetical protein
MKSLLLVWLMLAMCLCRGSADLVTFRFAGTVHAGGSDTVFSVGGTYVLTVTIDTATVGTPIVDADPQFGITRAYYTNAITSVVFDYGSGAYVGQAQGHGDVDIMNNERGLYDHFDLFDFRGEWQFPAVDGLSYANFGLMLTDGSMRAFDTTQLPVMLDVADFGGPQATPDQREAYMNWGQFDGRYRWIGMTIDEIVTSQRLPRILTHSVDGGELKLTIQLAGIAKDTLLERAFALGPTAVWEQVAALQAGSGTTNWNVMVATNISAMFYRVRSN